MEHSVSSRRLGHLIAVDVRTFEAGALDAGALDAETGAFEAGASAR